MRFSPCGPPVPHFVGLRDPDAPSASPAREERGFGLLCSRDGCPVAVKVFPGNTADPRTVAAQVEKLRHRFGLRQVVLVGDRGMLTSERLREDLRPEDGFRWVTALRSSAIRALVANGSVNPTLFDRRDLAEISSDLFPGERLVVCFNPRLEAERRRKREDLLRSTEEKLEAVVRATRREGRPLPHLGQFEIASS